MCRTRWAEWTPNLEADLAQKIDTTGRAAQTPSGSTGRSGAAGRVCGLLVAALLATLAFAQAAQAEVTHDTVVFSCPTVSYTYAGFPAASANTVTEILYVDGATFLTKSFSFDGPSGTDSIHIELPPGHHKIDARAKWKTNGVKGGHDQPHKGGLTCVPEPSFSITKLQQINRRAGFTSEMLFAARRLKVTYEIVVSNMGNVALTFHDLLDARCDAGTLSGGPGGEALAPGGSSIYTCSHRLTPEDQALGVFENEASVTGEPPPGEGPPLTQLSNPVIVELPNDTVGFACSSLTLSFAMFPNVPGNTVSEIVYVDHRVLLASTFSFDGPSGSNTIPIDLPPGHHSIDVRVRWKAGGVSGGHDQHLEGGLLCGSEEEVAR
jgi:hypothetical protein